MSINFVKDNKKEKETKDNIINSNDKRIQNIQKENIELNMKKEGIN